VGSFKDQVAIVTGGATGIGGATARTLARRGAKVLIADINEELAAANVQSITDADGTAVSIRVDVSKADDSQRMVAEAMDRWGRIDILVQNAFGVANMPAGFQGGAEDVEEDAWDYGISVLAKALYLGAKYTVPVMREGGGGNIVNLASVHSLLQAPGWLIYEAGKASVVGMTRQMATEYGPDGIRVNCVCPGHIVTEGIAEMWKSNPEGLEFYGDMYPLRRTGVPDDIAKAIAFLCSDDASFITGHALVVDGGLTIQIQEDFGVRMAEYARAHPEMVPSHHF
jgi:NAD(P)-dependent dehydrogenase (short-subunit alcohol dehydrogenase family)